MVLICAGSVKPGKAHLAILLKLNDIFLNEEGHGVLYDKHAEENEDGEKSEEFSQNQ